MKLNKKCPSVQHLLFGDDNLFLCWANFKESLEIIKCLKIYGDALGQEINSQKSSITFGEKLESNMRHLLDLFKWISKEGGTVLDFRSDLVVLKRTIIIHHGQTNITVEYLRPAYKKL